MRYFRKTFIWIIVLVGIGGYSFLDLESTRLDEVAKEEATRLLPFGPDEVLSIVIRKQDSEIELERWEEGWKVVKPYEAKADTKAVKKFLVQVTDSKNDAEYVMEEDPSAERLAEFGLAIPTLFLTLKTGKELTEHTLILGDRAPSMGIAFAQIQGEKPVYRILADVRSEADKDIHYFRDKSVLRLNTVMIDQVAINRQETSIRIKLPLDGKWMLERPIQARADHIKVFELMNAFANSEIKEFIAESKDDLALYGLDKPKIELTFWMSGDSEPTIKIRIGDRSPKKRGYYASMSDRDNIFLLGEKEVDLVPYDPNDLRSRELFYIERDKLKRIEIHEASKSIVIVKGLDKEWRRGKKDGEIVDFNLVKAFLDDLLEIRIEDFLTGDRKKAVDYGLEPPRARLLLWMEGSGVPIGVKVGKTTPAGNSVYATYGGSNEIVVFSDEMKRILRTYFF
jgi:hypothetical protein